MKFGVVGFGISGEALTKALLSLGFEPVVFELRSKNNFNQREVENLEKMGAKFIFNYAVKDFKKVDLTILSSGIKHDFFTENKIKFISELDFVCSFLDKNKKNYIFITGTKGKGTTAVFTKFLFEELGLKVFLGGNIGESEYSKPAASAIFENADVYIFEASSFQLRSSFSAKPLICAITNLGVDHLNWHDSLEDYWQSKLKFLEKAKYGIGQEEIIYKSLVIGSRKSNKIVFEILKDVPPEFRIKFIGEHNLCDLSLAYKILEVYAKNRGLKVANDLLQGVIKKIPKQKFVLQYEGEINGVKIYNDSKSTHYLSLKASLNSFNQPVILICGGLTKGFDFSDIEDTIRAKVKRGIIFGKDRKEIEKSFEKEKRLIVKDLETALGKALKFARKGDVILFSPGCASLDMFNSAIQRGKIFSELVRKYQNFKLPMKLN